jgi:putative ABC transport system substrate-binding protein
VALSLLLLAVVCVPAGPLAWGQEPGIVVVLRGDAPPYAAALDGFRAVLRQRAPDVALEVVGDGSSIDHADLLMAAANGAPPPLVVTLGASATREAAATIGDGPMLAGMILNANSLEGIDNATGVYLEHSAAVEVEWLRKLLPGKRRIGIVHSDATAERVAAIQRAADAAGLSVSAIKIDAAADIPVALDTISTRADLILGLADPLVYNAETVRPLLMFSFAERIPIVASSAGWVRAGALYALERDYTDVGAQCAELALQILDGRQPSTLASRPPREVRYVINERIANEMGIAIPGALLRAALEVVR